jgi:hypothetical protein
MGEVLTQPVQTVWNSFWDPDRRDRGDAFEQRLSF